MNEKHTNKHSRMRAPTLLSAAAFALIGYAAVSAGDANISGGKDASNKTPAIETSATNAKGAASANFRLHTNDIADWRGLLADAANGDDNTFANFRQRSQLRLFSSIDAALSQSAEDALSTFSAVRGAGIQLQTPLGARKGNIAVNIIGDIASSNSHAFGWQFRGYGGEGAIGGGNAGVFFRRIHGDTMVGANIFGDYEHNDYGDFLRYSIGGEMRDEHVEFAANFYLPIADERNVNSTVLAFSRRGYDAKLRASVPHLDVVKAGIDYYRFRGIKGASSEEGFRYAADWQPLAGLRFGVLYDDTLEKLGGDISYTHSIGNSPSRAGANNFNHDLFAPISREYTQRIATVGLSQLP